MSYDMIDRFLRNNLNDEDYAEYSAALDSLCTPQRKPLTDEEMLTVVHYSQLDNARAIEAKLKEKNT